MGGRGASSSQDKADRDMLNTYKNRLTKQGLTNIVTSIKNNERYLGGTIYRQGFRDTSFRMEKDGNNVRLIRYELGSRTPDVLANGTTEINKYMRKHGLVYRIGG